MPPRSTSHVYAVPYPVKGRGRPLKLDVIAAADTFTAQLEDVQKPGICAKCFSVFAHALLEEHCAPLAVQLLKSHHDFWTACARVASAPGSHGELSPLRSLLDSNIAACPTKSWHIYAVKGLRDSVACLMDALCRCLWVAVGSGSQRKHKNILLSKNGMWPSTLEQIMPEGIGAYARWACVLPTHCGLALVSRLTVIARRQVMAELIATPTRDRIAATLVRAFRQWRIRAVEFPAASRHLLAHDVDLGRPELEEASHILLQAMHMLLVFSDGPDGRLDDFGAFAAGYERLLHDAIIDLLTKPKVKDIKQTDGLVVFASVLQARAGLPVHPLVEKYRRQPDVQRYVQNGLTFGDTVFLYLRERNNSRLCSGPGCTKGARDGACTRALSFCARCRIMRYCSPECQKLDWKEGRCDVPHKIVCPALCKSLAHGLIGVDGSMAAFSDAYHRRTVLTDEETVSLTTLALLDDILPVEFKLGALSLFENTSRAGLLCDAVDGKSEAFIEEVSD